MGVRARVRSWLRRVGFVGLSSSVVVWGFVRGSQWVSVRVEVAFLVVVVGFLSAFVSTAVFSAFVSLSGLLYFLRLVRGAGHGEGEPDGDGERPPPTRPVTAIVPVYRDAAVLDRSVRSLLDSGYDDLRVLVVCEPDDGASIRRARELAARDRVDYLVNREAPGTKAGAINAALDRVETEVVGVFDADEVVHPSFVGSAVRRLDGCDVVQGRTVPEVTGTIEGLAYCESVVLSYVGRRLLYLLTGFRMAASRALVAERDAFRTVGGYDPSMLTEDFDFAYRCYKHRLTVREDLRHPSRIEAAHSVRDWWGQRKRWLTGYVQVLHRLGAEAVVPDDRRDLLSVGICAGTIVGSLLCLSLVSKFAVLVLLGADWALLLPLAVVTAVTFGVRVADASLGVVDAVGWSWALVAVVFPLYSLAATGAIVEYVLSGADEWYRVDKGSAAR